MGYNLMKDRTRRKVITAAGASVIAPSFVSVASGATDSGEVEVTTTTTQPTNTTVEIQVYEDISGDGNADNEQLETIEPGQDVITEYAALSGGEGNGIIYWLDVILSTSDDTVTPELDSITITLPEEGDESPEQIEGPDTPGEPDTFTELLQNYLVFVAAVVLGFTTIGLWGKSLAVGAFIGYIAFAYIAVTTQTPLLVNILYVTVVLVFIGMAFKLFRAEFGGE